MNSFFNIETQQIEDLQANLKTLNALRIKLHKIPKTVDKSFIAHQKVCLQTVCYYSYQLIKMTNNKKIIFKTRITY
jgi:prefoldin subunit 5